MQLKIQKQYLKDVADFLYNRLELKGKKSVDRMRVVKTLNNQNREFANEEMELLKQYATLDDEGNPVQFEDGTFKAKDVQEFKEQQKKLYEEEYILNDVNLDTALKTVKDAVINHDGELKGKDAFTHYYLYEQFNRDEENNAEDE